MAILSAAMVLAAPLGHIEAGDPLYPDQWWYARVGADRVEPPGPGVPVTVIDTGLDTSHPEFANRPDTELLTGQPTTQPVHGTAVSSVLAAPANGIGIVGVYPAARVRVWDASPRGLVSAREIVAGLGRAGPRSVVSISVGRAFREPLIELAVLQAFHRGAVIVAAAGNSGDSGNAPAYPGALPHVLTVGATTQDDVAAIFSTRSSYVDVAAPGVDIPVAVPVSIEPSGYGTAEGTSFATPIVAGAVAWIWSARPQLDKTQVVELIRRTARDLGARGRDDDTGFGLLTCRARSPRPRLRSTRRSRTTTSTRWAPAESSPRPRPR